MGSWNGASLTTEFSETLGDTSTGFKARVVKWMNDIQDDICSRYQWPFLHCFGKKLLTTGTEFQTLTPSSASAPSIVTQNGGSLTNGATYSVLVTFYMSSNGYETPADGASAAVACNTPNLQLSITSIPVSQEALVTSRRIYLSKNSGTYYFYSEILDNTSTSTTVSADVTSTREPPDYIGMKRLVGNPWLESNGIYLNHRSEDEMRQMFPVVFTSGIPEFFCSVDYNRIITYPMPSSALTLKFNYFKMPARIFNDSTIQPDMPIWMKQVLEAGVLMKGYQYRERDMAVTYKQLYEQLLMQAISEKSRSRQGATRVRDVAGDSDGYVF